MYCTPTYISIPYIYAHAHLYTYICIYLWSMYMYTVLISIYFAIFNYGTDYVRPFFLHLKSRGNWSQGRTHVESNNELISNHFHLDRKFRAHSRPKFPSRVWHLRSGRNSSRGGGRGWRQAFGPAAAGPPEWRQQRRALPKEWSSWGQEGFRFALNLL